MTSVVLDTPVRMGLLRWRVNGGDIVVYALNFIVAALFLLKVRPA